MRFLPFLLLVSSYSFGQITFQQAYSDAYVISNLRYDLQLTTDGGYIIAGTGDNSGSGNLSDVYLIKTDQGGNMEWSKFYGDTVMDYGYSVKQCFDGGYIIVGSIGRIAAPTSNVYLIKTDANGDTLWTRDYGGAGKEAGLCVQQTADSGYVIIGYTYSFGAGGIDIYFIRTDANGDTLWTKTIGGAEDDIAYSIQLTSDNGFIIVGSTWSYVAIDSCLNLICSDVYLIKTDENGDTMWTKSYGGESIDVGYSVQQTADGGYIIGGQALSFGNPGSSDYYLIKPMPQVMFNGLKYMMEDTTIRVTVRAKPQMGGIFLLGTPKVLEEVLQTMLTL